MKGCFYEKFIYGEVQTARCKHLAVDVRLQELSAVQEEPVSGGC